jgi:type IV pilus assembly protein PilC
MPLFDYTASDREGALSHGQLEAGNKQAATKMLASQGLFVLGVTVASKPALPREPEPKTPPTALDVVMAKPSQDVDAAFRARLEEALIDDETTVAVDTVKKKPARDLHALLPQRSWSRMDRALYLRQLQVMFEAGIPLYRCAAVLSEGREYSERVTAKLKEVPLDLERGRMLSKALERSGLFTPLIISSVRLGEESGRLDSILDALSGQEERAVQLSRALVSRLTYPAVVLTAMSGGLLVLGHVMGRVMSSLPAFQKTASPIIGTAARIFQNAAFLPTLLLLLAALVAGARRLWSSSGPRQALEDWIFSWPVAGPLLKRLEANTVTGHLALLIKAGLPIDRGLGLCADLVRTRSFRKALLSAALELRNGEELAQCFKRAELFPEDVLALVNAGEVSGSLESSLETAAGYCAEQVERTLESALSVLEPVLIGLLGIAIGAVLIVTFVPIFSTLKDL